MKRFLKWILFAVLFIVGYYLLNSLTGGLNVSVIFGNGTDVLTLSGPRKTSEIVQYDDIASLELVGLDDPGEAVDDGGSNRKYYWGTWENESYGTYRLFASRKISVAIKLTKSDGSIILFNLESDTTTTNMYSMFTELLAHR